MNAQPTAPRVTKETKNKIKVEFERTPLIERLKAKFINMAFVTDVIWYIFRLLLLIGIAYIVLFPFYTKIAGSFMGKEDFVDVTVMLIPKHFSLDIYRFIILENDYFTAFGNTLLLAGSTAIIQTFICCLIGYGLAKFKFKGAKYVFLAVILTMVVPHQTLQLSMFMEFRFFDILGIVKFLSGHATVGNIEWLNKILAAINIFPAESKNAILKGIIADGALNLNNTYWPLIVLSLTGLGFKNGLYIFRLRQFKQDHTDAGHRKDPDHAGNQLRRSEPLLSRYQKHLRADDHIPSGHPLRIPAELPCSGYREIRPYSRLIRL